MLLFDDDDASINELNGLLFTVSDMYSKSLVDLGKESLLGNVAFSNQMPSRRGSHQLGATGHAGWQVMGAGVEHTQVGKGWCNTSFTNTAL